MSTITRKSETKALLHLCILSYDLHGLDSCVNKLHELLLSRRVKFPLLEYCAEQFYQTLTAEEHLPFLDKIEALKTEGGNVILGIVLQKRLSDHFDQSIDKASEFIAKADIWYVCDIIGERVFGYALLNFPAKAFPYFKQLFQHSSHWVVRSLGAGAHYAIKKGLSEDDVKKLFPLLLSYANNKNKEIRQGVGWAAKTTAKFHPNTITSFQAEIQDTLQVANWFRTKISIGLKRHQYAQRN